MTEVDIVAKSTPIEGHNPEILAWARETLGLRPEDVATRLKKTPRDILAWEAGTASPTYPQLERLAYDIYKRPLALFFFPEPPQENGPEHAFRTLPDAEIEALAPDTRLKIRQAQRFQFSLRELCSGVNPSVKKVFREVEVGPRSTATAVARQLRSYFGVSLEAQRVWRTSREALKGWRDLVEEHGVFTFKGPFKDAGISGFCLYDTEFPVVYINNKNSYSRQIFTLFHELSHILYRLSGVTKASDGFFENLTEKARNIEIFCNQVAGEFLVPEQELLSRLRGRQPTDEVIRELAEFYTVSREVVLRRLIDNRTLDRSTYTSRVRRWSEEDRNQSRDGGGGDYYRTKAAYLGPSYLRLAFQKYHQGAITESQLADHLDIKVGNLPKLEQQLLAQLSA